MMLSRHTTVSMTVIAILMSTTILVGCGNKESTQEEKVGGARSAVFGLDEIPQNMISAVSRSAALLGVYTTEFLSRGSSFIMQSALSGIDAQLVFAAKEQGTQNQDFALLQAFANALQVNIPELLNRSPDREQSLTKYIEALRNVGQRSIDRFNELDTAMKNLKDRKNEKRKEVNKLKREQKNAIKDKDFTLASEIQEQLSEEQEQLSELELDLSKTNNIHETFDDLLDIYGERLLAIESNKKALIVGISVVNVPGAQDLEILDNPSRRQRNENLDFLLDGGKLSEMLGIGSE